MPFNEFPYTNFHDLNQDWMIKTLKEVKDKADNIDTSVEEANASAEAAKLSEENAKTSEENAKTSEEKAKSFLDNVEEYTYALSQQVNTNTQNISVNSGRIDTFTQLAQGSTTGDAELQDIRVGYDGTVYSTAGDAVRGQIGELDNSIGKLGVEHYNLYSGINNTLNKYINADNGNLITSTSFQVSDYIDISPYNFSEINISYTFNGAFYDSSKAFISSFGRSDDTDKTIKVPTNAKYARITINNSYTGVVQIGRNVSRLNYVPYRYYELTNAKINIEQTDASNAFEKSNLFNKSNVLENRYIGSENGNVGTMTGFNASDFIDIGANEYVTISNSINAVAYHSDKTYSRDLTRKYTNYPITALLNNDEQYIRITVRNTFLDSAKVEKNIGGSSFTEYGNTVKSSGVSSVAFKKTKVYVGEGCCFTTINSALEAITDASPKNRYELFITEGEYNESITTKDYVDLVGESKYKSIINYISDNESNYVNRSTIFATTYTIIKNLTVKTTGSKYPLHCDARYNEPYEVKVINCIFKHDGFTGSEQPAGTAVGVGLYWGQHVSLEECECIGSGIVGCASIYCHNSIETDASHSRFRSLTIKNCILSNATYGLRLQAIENNQLQANECIYIGNKNTATIPVSVEANSYQSWHVLSINNNPDYIQ